MLSEGCYYPAVGNLMDSSQLFKLYLQVHIAHWLDCPRSIGLSHASYLDSNGNNVEYGDSSSPMGSGTVGISNSFPPSVPCLNMSTCTCIMQLDNLVSKGFENKSGGPKLIRMLCPSAAFSPANDYQMGWSSPVQLTGRNFPMGATVTITTPAVTHSSKSGIRIVPDWYVPYLMYIQLQFASDV